MAIIKLYKDAPGPVKCRGGIPGQKGVSCGADTFVIYDCTVDTSKKDAVVSLGCHTCGTRFEHIDTDRRGLGQPYGEIKYPVRDHKQELIAYAKDRDAEWDEWASEEGVQEAPKIDPSELDWGEDEDEEAAEPPANINVDELDWD
jgi:hypothetical protein